MQPGIYDNLKSSGSAWLGDIPKHWDVKKLKFLATVQPSNVDKKTVEGEEPVILCNYTDVYKNEYIDSRLEFMQASATSAEIKKFAVDVGDVIVTKDSETPGDIAVPACIAEKIESLVCGYHLTQIKPINLYGRYLFRLFQAKGFNAQFTVAANGVTRFGLPQHAIANALSPIPPIEEQQTIARFLDFKTAQIDALISKKQTLLDKLAEKRTALISHAVTKGLDSSVPMKDSGVAWLGEIPAHWEAKRLKFVVSTFGGGTPNTGKPEYWNGEIPWVSPKDMKCDFIDATEDYLTDLGVTESATKIVPVDSVLIVVRSGILRHTIPVARNTVKVSLNQDMKALVASDRLRPGFIHWFISGLQGGLLPLWSKQGCTVESIEMAYMTNTVIPLPPLDEQDAILENITKITAKIDEQVKKVADVISALAEYRSSLITHAVTGKIDVRDFQAPQFVEGAAS